MSWRRTLARKAISVRLPAGDFLRRQKRKYLGYPPAIDNLELTVANYSTMKKKIESLGRAVQDSVVLEIGTGWLPTIPLLLAKDGAREVLMTDLHVHMDDVTFAETVKFLRSKYPEDTYFRDISDLSSVPLRYMAPFDIDDVPPASVDIVVSHTCLEHVPKSDIYRIHASLRPKMSSRGCMVHSVDHSDHFEHYDKSLSRVNFLSWSEEKHALINYLTKGGENRLRHHEYERIFLDAGFELVDEETILHAPTLENLDSVDLLYPWSTMSKEQIATVNSIYSLLPR